MMLMMRLNSGDVDDDGSQDVAMRMIRDYDDDNDTCGDGFARDKATVCWTTLLMVLMVPLEKMMILRMLVAP